MSPKPPASAQVRTWRSKHEKPPSCSQCPAAAYTRGYVPADGPPRSSITFLGETPWFDELAAGYPFAGMAGSMFDRLLRRNGYQRSDYRVENTLRCAPPQLEFTHESWMHGAVDYCSRTYTDHTLHEGSPVIVPLGNLAIRRTLNLWGTGINVEDFHGTVTRTPDDTAWVVPTFHPGYLQRGAVNLIGVVSFDLHRAHEVAQHGWEPDPLELILDPPLDWLRAWGETYLAAVAQDPVNTWLAVDIETDEKAGKNEASLGPLTPEIRADKVAYDRSYNITRLNLSCHPDQGITLPWVEPFISWARTILAAAGTKVLWFGDYDWPRLEAADCPLGGTVYDLPWACHLLQSDVPLGLGFWAPFYSRYGAWKHLSSTHPATYAAIDGPQTLRVGYGAIADVLANGQWYAFERHVHTLKQAVLQPAHNVGVLIDKEKLTAFEVELTEKAAAIQARIQAHVPDALRPLTPKHGLKAQPISTQHTYARTTTARGDREKKRPPDTLKMGLFAHAEVISKIVIQRVNVCETCGALDVIARHRCKDEQGRPSKDLIPQVVNKPASVTRWFWKEPFNPESAPQLLAYMKHHGHEPGRAKRTGKDTTDKDTLERLKRTTEDPLYDDVLKLRAVTKVRSTYVIGTRKRLDQNNRVHPTPTFRPSTQRLSYIDPNITNVIADRGGQASLAAGYRKCVVASPGCRLLEVDFGGIEAVLTGWFARDPGYIRLARLGVHAGLASHVLKRPFNPAWSDEELGAYFKEIKKTERVIYDTCKRTVHGNGYGLTEWGMVRNFPDTFPTLAVARKYRNLFFKMAPRVPAWQFDVRQFTDQHGFIGGSGQPGAQPPPGTNIFELDQPGEAPFGSPWGYKHWFWSIFTYTRISFEQYVNSRRIAEQKHQPAGVKEIGNAYYRIGWGEDSKRCIAFLPQSTAAGVLKETMLRLFADPDHPHYIGNAYYDQTPLRGPIHDSLLLEIPVDQWDRVLEAVCTEMLRPIPQMPLPAEWGLGPYLSIGIEAKAGSIGGSWDDLETIAIPQAERGVGGDDLPFPAEEADEDEFEDLGVVA